MAKFAKSKYELLDKRIPKLIQEGKTCKEICKELNVSKSTVNRRCKKLSLSIPNYHNQLKFDNTVFDNINTEEKAYWLGFLYADGNVCYDKNIISISLKREDKSHLEKFKCFLNAKCNIKDNIVKVKNKEYKTSRIQVCDKHFKQTLISLGCVPRKSLILTFPLIEIFAQKELIYDFIRGYVDGDGCLTFTANGKLCLYILGTKEFLEGIVKVFPEKFKSIHKIKRLATNVYKISNSGENATYVALKLYDKATIYLDRKYNRFAVLCRNT